jgi:hypothetical protein
VRVRRRRRIACALVAVAAVVALWFGGSDRRDGARVERRDAERGPERDSERDPAAARAAPPAERCAPGALAPRPGDGPRERTLRVGVRDTAGAGVPRASFSWRAPDSSKPAPLDAPVSLDGRYALAIPADGAGALHVEAHGYVTFPEGPSPEHEHEHQCVLTAGRACTLRGRVVYDTGEPVAGARVDLLATRLLAVESTDAGGAFAFTEPYSGRVTVRAFPALDAAGGGARFASRQLEEKHQAKFRNELEARFIVSKTEGN